MRRCCSGNQRRVDNQKSRRLTGVRAVLKAIASEIETHLREHCSVRPLAVDGFPASQWMVLDYLQVVVHIFHRDKRAFYSLEGLWGDAPVLQWESISTR